MKSDWDYIIIIDDSVPIMTNTIMSYGNMDLYLFGYSQFIDSMYNQDICVIEAIHANDTNTIIQNKVDFQKIAIAEN